MELSQRGRHCLCVCAWSVARPSKTVLVVEDNAHWRKLLTMVIERAGYVVLQATTGGEAVEKATAALPDLILMDLGLPEMNGDEATAILKRNSATRDIPIVIQTAYACTENAATAGASEVLHKPIELTEIHRVLRKYASNEATQTMPHDSHARDEVRPGRLG
jgi:two-component system cell cycle response regulator DivK